MPGQPYFSMMAPGLIISLRQLGFQWKTLTGGNHQTHVQSKTCIVHQYKNFNMILHHELNFISFNPNKDGSDTTVRFGDRCGSVDFKNFMKSGPNPNPKISLLAIKTYDYMHVQI